MKPLIKTLLAVLLAIVLIVLGSRLFLRAQEPLPTVTPEPFDSMSAPAGLVPAGFALDGYPDAPRVEMFDGALPDLAAAALELLNAERISAGCGELSSQPLLGDVTLAHSRDMAESDYFDHDDLAGVDPGGRATVAGYPWSRYAENIAAGFPSAHAVVKAWMGSAGHRANILNCSLTETGLGVFYNPESTYHYYWTHDLARRAAGASLPTPTPTSLPQPPISVPSQHKIRLPYIMSN